MKKSLSQIDLPANSKLSSIAKAESNVTGDMLRKPRAQQSTERKVSRSRFPESTEIVRKTRDESELKRRKNISSLEVSGNEEPGQTANNSVRKEKSKS
jgi:hypothetical protein